MQKNINHLICYDISEPKRLAKIARYLTKIAFRIQYSIYFLPNASHEEIEKIKSTLLEMMDEDKDDIRIYRIKHHGFTYGVAVDLSHPFILV